MANGQTQTICYVVKAEYSHEDTGQSHSSKLNVITEVRWPSSSQCNEWCKNLQAEYSTWNNWVGKSLIRSFQFCNGHLYPDWVSHLVGIRYECHRQKAYVWNATDLCVWGFGVGAGTFCIGVLGYSILSLAFCPEIHLGMVWAELMLVARNAVNTIPYIIIPVMKATDG